MVSLILQPVECVLEGVDGIVASTPIPKTRDSLPEEVT